MFRPEEMWVQRDTFFFFLSWLVALCTSGFIITIINKGYDILPALYWQVLDYFPFIEHHYSNWKEAVAANKGYALYAAAGSEKRSWSHFTPQVFFTFFSERTRWLSGSKEVVTTIICWNSTGQPVTRWQNTTVQEPRRETFKGYWLWNAPVALSGLIFSFPSHWKRARHIPSPAEQPAATASSPDISEEKLKTGACEDEFEEKWRYLSLWWTKSGHSCLLSAWVWMMRRSVFLRVQWGIYLFLTRLLICVFVCWAWCDMCSRQFCSAVLS